MKNTARLMALGLAGTLMLGGCNSDKKKPEGKTEKKEANPAPEGPAKKAK